MAKNYMCICNCDYNTTKQLTKATQLLWNIGGYIEDAKKDKHSGCVKMWQVIKKDVEKHVHMLRSAIEGKVKAGKYCEVCY